MTHDPSKTAPTAPALSLVQTMLQESTPKAQAGQSEDADLDVEALRAIQGAAAEQVQAIRRDDVLVRSESLF